MDLSALGKLAMSMNPNAQDTSQKLLTQLGQYPSGPQNILQGTITPTPKALPKVPTPAQAGYQTYPVQAAGQAGTSGSPSALQDLAAALLGVNMLSSGVNSISNLLGTGTTLASGLDKLTGGTLSSGLGSLWDSLTGANSLPATSGGVSGGEILSGGPYEAGSIISEPASTLAGDASGMSALAQSDALGELASLAPSTATDVVSGSATGMGALADALPTATDVVSGSALGTGALADAGSMYGGMTAATAADLAGAPLGAAAAEAGTTAGAEGLGAGLAAGVGPLAGAGLVSAPLVIGGIVQAIANNWNKNKTPDQLAEGWGTTMDATLKNFGNLQGAIAAAQNGDRNSLAMQSQLAQLKTLKDKGPQTQQDYLNLQALNSVYPGWQNQSGWDQITWGDPYTTMSPDQQALSARWAPNYGLSDSQGQGGN